MFRGRARALDAQTSISTEGTIESTAGGFKFPDGSVQLAAAVPPSNVLVVAKSGAPFDSIQEALDSISDAGADNPYLVFVAPGIYTERVKMKPHVDVQGAGMQTVVISSPAAGTGSPTLKTAADAELRFLTVGSTASAGLDSVAVGCESSGRLHRVAIEAETSSAGGSVSARGVYGFPCEELVLRGVEVTSSGSSRLNNGLFINDFPAGPPPSLSVFDSHFSVHGGTGGSNAVGIAAQGSVTIANTSITVQDGANSNTGFYLGSRPDSQVQLEGVTILVGAATIGSGLGVSGQDHGTDSARIRIDRSSISSPDDSILTRTGISVVVGASMLDGSVETSFGGSVTCVASYDSSYTALDSFCAAVTP